MILFALFTGQSRGRGLLKTHKDMSGAAAWIPSGLLPKTWDLTIPGPHLHAGGHGDLKGAFMWCIKCNHDLSECTCPDLMDRLNSVAEGGNFVYRRCRVCQMHYSQCKCVEPNWELVGGQIKS